MQIDFKYILRYGMPGWFLCITLIINFCLINNISFIELFSAEYTAIISMLVGLVIFGVPIGYVLNRLGMFLWLWKVKEEAYFEAEMAIDNVLKKDDFLRERYRYMLTALHGAQTLCIAAAFAFALNVGVTTYGFYVTDHIVENGYESEILETTTEKNLLTETVTSEADSETITSTTKDISSTKPVVNLVSLSEFEKNMKETFMAISFILCLVLFSSVFVFYLTAEYHERNLDYFIEHNVLKTKPNYVNPTIFEKGRATLNKLFQFVSKLFSSK